MIRGTSAWGCPSSCVPSMNIDLEVKVLWEVGRDDPSEPQGADREGSTERSGVARPVGRRTETGYEAGRIRASGHVTAKLSRPKRRLEARTDRLSRATAARGIAPRGGDGGAIHGQLVASGRPCRPASRSAHVVFRSAWRTTTRHALTSTHRTAGCGPACPVVWEGSRRAILSYSLSRFIGVLLRQSSCDAAPTSPPPSSTPPPHPPPATESTSCPDRSSAPSRHSATT